MQRGFHDDDVQNIRSVLEAYIFLIAAAVYQHMAKTITDLRRNWRNALKREKELNTQVNGLTELNANLIAENSALKQKLAATRDTSSDNSVPSSER